MIDAHLHVVPPRLPGVGPLDPRLELSPDKVALWLRQELELAGIRLALAMGSWSTSDDDPLGVYQSAKIAELVPNLAIAGIADPSHCDSEHIRRCERALTHFPVKALKIYLGYLHYYPSDVHYRPYYELAERHKLPVVFHCGDAYSPFAKLKYAHPLNIDEVAVDHPRVRFVMAHLGNPWLADAAAVIYKNFNVWADLSGLVVGNEWQNPNDEQACALDDLRCAVQRAIRYAERPNRFLFGTDWPLVNIRAYRDLIASWLPDHYHELVFEQNALSLFGF